MDTAQSGPPSGTIDKAVNEITGVKEPRLRPEFSVSSYAIPMGREFQQVFGPGRSRQAELIKRREIRSFLEGDKRCRRMIIVQSYREYISRQLEREDAGEIGTASPNPRARKRRGLAITSVAENSILSVSRKKKTGLVSKQSPRGRPGAAR